MSIENDLLFGFQSTYFQLLNAESQVVFSSNCGGGHRSCQFWVKDKVANLLFVRKGSPILERNKLKEYKVNKIDNQHADHINAIVKINEHVIATCGEDTKVIVNSTVLDAHRSSVRAMLYDAPYLITTGGQASKSCDCVI